MRTVGRISYWILAIAMLTAILVSLDYSTAQALLISLGFCPFAILLEYLMPKAKKTRDKVYLSLAVLISIILLILFIHFCVWTKLTDTGYVDRSKQVAPMLINPVFLGLILTALAIGDYFWAKWIDKRFKAKERTVTFFSERRKVTLRLADIAYVESNDTEVRIVTTANESYRNKTGIGQWGNLLGDDFLRIHRSYLVNTSLATLSSQESVSVGPARVQLPISRKYKEYVKNALSATEGM
ncbi:MAG: LytTR family transcriptional regulator [Bacteroidales bacterium]|nr:LytTR family transcriptional regulator [Bacteroidales bacterium]